MSVRLDFDHLRNLADTWSVDIPDNLTRTQVVKLILAFQYQGMAVTMQVVPPEAFADPAVRDQITADCIAVYDQLLAEVARGASGG